MFNFLYSKIVDVISNIRASSYFQFVFDLFRKWYYAMALMGVYAGYHLFKALKDKGILDKFEAILKSFEASLYTISTKCFPMIDNLRAMFDCIKRS